MPDSYIRRPPTPGQPHTFYVMSGSLPLLLLRVLEASHLPETRFESTFVGKSVSRIGVTGTVMYVCMYVWMYVCRGAVGNRRGRYRPLEA